MFRKNFKSMIATILSAFVMLSNLSISMPVMAVSDKTQQKGSFETTEHENLSQQEYENVEMIQYMNTTSLVAEEEIIWDEDKEKIDIPKRYSAVDQGFTPAVRNQAPYGNCWSHAGIACLEIGMLRNNLNMGIPASEFSLSIPHAIYYGFRPVLDPLGLNADDVAANSTKDTYSMLNGGGAPGYIGTTALCWLGPVMSDDFYTFSDLTTYYATVDMGKPLATEALAYGNRVATVTEMVEMDKTERDEIKRAVLKYGAVATGHKSGGYFSYQYDSQYTPVSGSTNHAITIVGWNDDFPKENFMQEAPGDGAWLIRNSAGTGYGNGGYFWLSYYDKTMDGGTAFKVEAADKYDNNYFYDMVNSTYSWVDCSRNSRLEVANVFTIQKDKELVKAVQYDLFQDCYNYSIELYLNPENDDPSSGEKLLDKPITGNKKLRGTYTSDLEKPIWVKKGDVIAVCVSIGATKEATLSPMAETDRIETCQKGRSYYRVDDGEWTDCADASKGNFLIRLFTNNDKDNVGENHYHVWSTKWEYDGDYHWVECEGPGTCNAETTSWERKYQKHYGGHADCRNKAVCEGCHQEYGYVLDYAHVGDKVCEVCHEEIDPRDRQGVKNLDYNFTAMDGTEVSSTVGEKPRLLFFFGADCRISKATMNNLTQERLPGVDIVAVDVGLKTKEQVQVFIDSYAQNPGTKDITFCYEGPDDLSIRWNYSNAYTAVYPDTSLGTMPILYYIDTNNTIKYVTSGEQTLEEIKNNLVTYAGYAVAGLNKPNPATLEFTTIDGEKVSSVSTGERPKVLVIGGPLMDDATKDTLASYESAFPTGVDIYYVTPWHTAEQLIELKEGVKSDGRVVYCTTTDYGLWDYYLKAASIDTSKGVSAPVIAYIDGNNNLQQVTQRESNVEQLMSILKSSCFYEEKKEEVEAVDLLKLIKPEKNVYVIGEQLSLDGGMVGIDEENMVPIETYMISSFDSETPGIQDITVTYQDNVVVFSVIVLESPTVSAKVGDTLNSISIPENSYGFFTWKNPNVILQEAGTTYQEVIFTPNDFMNYTRREGIQVVIEVSEDSSVIPPTEPEVETYTISYKLMGKGQDINTTATKGEKLTPPVEPETEGYEFAGWYKDEDYKSQWDFATDAVNQNTTLYAKWVEKIVEVTQVTLNKTELTLEIGEKEKLQVTVLPINATDASVSWSSSDETIATVSETGEVTAVKEGTAIITVSSGNGKMATCEVTVTASEGGNQGGTEGDNQGGTEGDNQGGTEGDNQGGTEGDNQGGTEGDNQGGTEGDNQGGTEGDNQGGTEGDNQGGTEGNNQGGTEGDNQGGTEGDNQGGTEGDNQSGSEGDNQGGTEGDTQGGTEGDNQGEIESGTESEEEKVETEKEAEEAKKVEKEKQEIQTIISQATMLKAEDYTQESWSVYQVVMNKVQILLKDVNTTSTVLAQVKVELQNAQNALVKHTPVEIPEQDTTPVIVHKKGQKLKVGNSTYKVIKAGLTSGEVAFTKYNGKAVTFKMASTIKVDGIIYKITAIDKNAFQNNKTLKSITVGKNVTAIGNNAFRKCTKLTSVTITKNVTTLGNYLFKDAKKLKSISIKGTKLKKKSIGKNAFAGVKKSVKIQVPKKQIKIYQKIFQSRGLTKKVKVAILK